MKTFECGLSTGKRRKQVTPNKKLIVNNDVFVEAGLLFVVQKRTKGIRKTRMANGLV
jgi:hypothetical protein